MSSPAAALASRYEAAAAAFVKEHRLPGAAVGVVHDGELAWSGGVGFADRATRRPSDPKTLYRIASITKTFTATAVMQLRDAGKLALDDPAIAYLPELAAAQSPLGPLETLTIRRMLSHESGLQSEPPGTNWSDVLYEDDPNRTLSRASEIALRVPVHTQWKYSNLAYQLLGEIVARVSGTTYPKYIRSKILRPLGMTATSLDPLAARLRARRASGYEPRFLSDELELAPEEASVFGAEGGLWSCVDDLARWLSCQLADDPKIIDKRTLEEMHKPRYLTDDEWLNAWCIGWYAQPPRGHRLDHALGRLLRLHHERVLRAEGEGRRDRARERQRGRDRARPPARDHRPRSGARGGAGDRGAGAAPRRLAAVRRPLHGPSLRDDHAPRMARRQAHSPRPGRSDLEADARADGLTQMSSRSSQGFVSLASSRASSAARTGV